MTETLTTDALDQLFRSARFGSVALPCQRGEILLTLLAAHPDEARRARLLAAPLTVIIGNEAGFADHVPKLMPHNYEAMQKAFAPSPVAEATAMRNGTLQGAYLIIAARSRVRLRADVGLRPGGCGSSVLRGPPHQVELHLLDRAWRHRRAVPTQPAAVVRWSQPVRL